MAHWRRILYVSFVAQTLSLIGFSFVFPFLPLYIQTLGVHGRAVPLWSGVISFGLSIAMALVAPVWGTLADRYGRKPMVVRAMAGGVVTTGLLIIAPNVWVVLLLRILQGILAGSVAASQALVASVTPREEMAFSMGLMQAAVLTDAHYASLGCRSSAAAARRW
jgi:DHA1 family multidrug resistance protein-like MFS transporter